MPDFHIVQDPNALTFDDAKKAFSAEMREGLARAAARARIPEDDVFWGLLVALTELSNTGLEAQSKLIKTILDQFVSARSAENKEYADRLAAHEAATKALFQETRQTRDEAEKMLRDVERKFSHRAVEVIAAADKTTSTAAQLRLFSQRLIWSAVAGALVLGMLLEGLLSLFLGWRR